MAQPSSRKQKVVIVGAGPVGSLAALYAAARGDDVELYELRGDLRDPDTIPLNFTKSINLALSERGITSMWSSNRESMIHKVLDESIPMHGRMIHGRNSGKLWEDAQQYDVHGRAINAVDRGALNNALLDELESTPNVKMYFNHKLTGADFRTNKAWFERRTPGETPPSGSGNRVPEIEVDFDYLIGADGAHSASRYHMMKFSRVDYQQEYIDTLWCEFRIPPSETGEFRISPNHLHIWPGKEFMFIASMFKPKPLTVRGVHEGLLGIAKVQGHGSQDKKISGIKKLLSAADAATAGKGSKGVDITKDKGGPSEAKFIVRFLEGKLRLGLAEKTVLVALAQAVVAHESALKGEKAPSAEKMAEGEAILKTVYSELPAYEVIIPAVLEHGLLKLGEVCKLQPGIPIKPMLAKPTKSITEVLDRFEGRDFTCEYKYDGERAQIHYVAPDSIDQYPGATATLQRDTKGLSSIFSRNSEDLSKKYPDVLAKLDGWIKDGVTSFVLDCETVAWDTENKKVLPFQQLMTRKRKDVKAEDVKVKVCVFAFDLLFLNGETTVKKSLRERRELLHQSFQGIEGEFQFAQYGNTNVVDEIQNLLDESVKASCEGLMVKMLDTEESGYEPSKRSRNWLKVKKDYLSGVGDSLDLVVLGAYYGRGKRTSVYGAFLLAAYNSSTQTYETICNIGTGFSEAILEEFHKALSPLVIDRPKPFYSHSTVPKDQPDVWFEPRLVWEVKTADLTLSPRYQAAADEFVGTTGGGKGVSLRFPRFIKSRDDKKPEQATTTRAVAEMYRKQEAVLKENAGKGGVDDDFEY